MRLALVIALAWLGLAACAEAPPPAGAAPPAEPKAQRGTGLGSY